MRIYRKSAGLRHARVTIAFTGAAGLGAVGTVALFTITGRIWIDTLTAFCTEALAEAAASATVACGVAADTDAFIAVTNAIDIDLNEWWNSATPAAGAVTITGTGTTGPSTLQKRKLVSTNIILTVAAQNITDGTIVFDVFYMPVTDNGLLT